MIDTLPYMKEFLLSAVATLGFGLLFNVPRHALLACCITGAIGRVVRMGAIDAGASLAGASYIGSLAVAMTGYLLARAYRTPRMVFTVTGVIPMVPGVPAFSTMLHIASGNYDEGVANAIQTLLIGGALAMGLTTVRVLTRVPGRFADPSNQP
jgi:uncharacterized membrane protein YjjB (DUF3815 family)